MEHSSITVLIFWASMLRLGRFCLRRRGERRMGSVCPQQGVCVLEGTGNG